MKQSAKKQRRFEKFFNWIDEKNEKISINSLILSYSEEEIEEELPQHLIYSEICRVGKDKGLVNFYEYKINDRKSKKVVIFKDSSGKKYYLTKEEFAALKEAYLKIQEKSDFFISFLYLPSETEKNQQVLSIRIYLQYLDYQ